MGQANLKESLDKAIADLERKRAEIDGALEKFRSARSAIDAMSPELLSVLNLQEKVRERQENRVDEKEDEESSPDEAGESADGVLGTAFERIKRYLSEQISPQTIADIEREARVSRASVSAVLYRTHKDEFLSLPMPGDTRAKGWVLKDSSIGRTTVAYQEEDIPF